jgi:hypothetical protein
MALKIRSHFYNFSQYLERCRFLNNHSQRQVYQRYRTFTYFRQKQRNCYSVTSTRICNVNAALVLNTTEGRGDSECMCTSNIAFPSFPGINYTRQYSAILNRKEHGFDFRRSCLISLVSHTNNTVRTSNFITPVCKN